MSLHHVPQDSIDSIWRCCDLVRTEHGRRERERDKREGRGRGRRGDKRRKLPTTRIQKKYESKHHYSYIKHVSKVEALTLPQTLGINGTPSIKSCGTTESVSLRFKKPISLNLRECKLTTYIINYIFESRP
jgi:hypothetical protein